MDLGTFVMWLVVGLGTGWLAGYVMKGGGYGLTGDLILGLVGSIAGSWVFGALGVSPGAGMVLLVVVAFVGAAAAIFAQRQIWAHA